MKLKTTINISFNDWISQASRFTRGTDALLVRNMPQNTDTSEKAEIIVNIKKPLLYGFDAEIIYRQNYTTQVENPILNENLEPTGQTETVDVNNHIDVIKYNATRSFAEIDAILNQLDANNTNGSTGLQRQKENVMTAILMDVLQHQTFKTAEFPNGLTAAEYETIY